MAILVWLAKHLAFDVLVLGSLLFTILYRFCHEFMTTHFVAATSITRDKADLKRFCLGNLGFTSLIHYDFAHYGINMIFCVPGSILVENLYGTPIALITIIAYMLTCGLITFFKKKSESTIGAGDVGVLLLGMVFFWKLNIIGIILYVLLVISVIVAAKRDRSSFRDYKAITVATFLGPIVGLAIQHFILGVI